MIQQPFSSQHINSHGAIQFTSIKPNSALVWPFHVHCFMPPSMNLIDTFQSLSKVRSTGGDWGQKIYEKSGWELNCNLTHWEQLHDTSNRWRLGVTVIIMRELNCNSWITVKLSAAIFWNWLAAALNMSNYNDTQIPNCHRFFPSTPVPMSKYIEVPWIPMQFLWNVAMTGQCKG